MPGLARAGRSRRPRARTRVALNSSGAAPVWTTVPEGRRATNRGGDGRSSPVSGRVAGDRKAPFTAVRAASPNIGGAAGITVTPSRRGWSATYAEWVASSRPGEHQICSALAVEPVNRRWQVASIDHQRAWNPGGSIQPTAMMARSASTRDLGNSLMAPEGHEPSPEL